MPSFHPMSAWGGWGALAKRFQESEPSSTTMSSSLNKGCQPSHNASISWELATKKTTSQGKMNDTSSYIYVHIIIPCKIEHVSYVNAIQEYANWRTAYNWTTSPSMPFVNFCLCSQCSFCSFGKSLPKVRKIKVKLRPSRFSSPLWGRSGPKRKGQKSPNISLWIFGLVQKVSFPSFFHQDHGWISKCMQFGWFRASQKMEKRRQELHSRTS